ncbi:MAG TPA: F0F1 ATP synthase subunit A [Phycisphaerales bacterium]|nr:F0F1 ATP synthase subunit A [Phycisphaerales bacterium]
MLLLSEENPINHVTDVILVGSKSFPVITMHMVMLMISGLLTWWLLATAAKGIGTGPQSQGNDRYITQGRMARIVEAMIMYLRDEMITPVLGEKSSRKYLPVLLSIFFFILINNLLGLIPLTAIQELFGLEAITGGKTIIGGTATGNIAVTGAMAFFAFCLIQVHAFRDLGVKGWLQHHCGGLVPGPIFLFPVVLIIFIVEVMGDIIKPAALAIRLFANMVAGHTLMAVLLGFGAMAAENHLGTAGVGGITLVSGLFALAISFLELFVAFLQAFIFMFLTAVFISLLSHGEEHFEEESAHEMEESVHHPHGEHHPAHA